MYLRFIAAALIASTITLGISLGADRCDFAAYKPLRIVPEGKTIKESAVPEYPTEAMKRRIAGTVSVRVLFDAKGIVQRACAVTGHRTLRDAAERAALKNVFEPLLINNTAVPYVEQYIVFNFVLPKDSDLEATESVEYCNLIKNQGYDRKTVRVRGIFTTDFEQSTFESPDCPVPKEAMFLNTWIDFDPAYDRLTKRKWRQALEKIQWRRPVEVVFVGLYEDKRTEPNYAGQGFGHMDMYSHRLVVTTVEYVGPLKKENVR